MQYSSIRVTKQLKKELDRRGKRGQSYEAIIKEGMGISFEPEVKESNRKLKPRMDKTPEVTQKVIELWNSGMKSPSEIGKELGYSKQTASVAIRRMLSSGIIK